MATTTTASRIASVRAHATSAADRAGPLVQRLATAARVLVVRTIFGTAAVRLVALLFGWHQPRSPLTAGILVAVMSIASGLITSPAGQVADDPTDDQ